ncbi:MAG: 3'-5' exonuclease [Hyphomicrobiaceae bacterium]|nr:3'-5' exonuclease [Hyphomicrobiaceae bacterium]
MKIGLVYDTETTGMPDWHQPSDAPQQPHIVQLGACLIDLDTKDIIETLDVIVRPDGWEIPEEATEVHGITTAQALADGIPEVEAVEQLLAMWQRAEVRIGHNESFDARIIRIATKRYFDEGTQEAWKAGKEAAECTAKLSTKILQLPPTEKMKRARRFHFKTPNLTEAYGFFTGVELENAHSAMADTLACAEVYFGVQAHNAKPEESASGQ